MAQLLRLALVAAAFLAAAGQQRSLQDAVFPHLHTSVEFDTSLVPRLPDIPLDQAPLVGLIVCDVMASTAARSQLPWVQGFYPSTIPYF